MKCENEFIADLYSDMPDAQCGDSSDGNGWYGLYIAPFTRCDIEAVILFERTDGIVESKTYSDIDNAMSVWTRIERIAECYA